MNICVVSGSNQELQEAFNIIEGFKRHVTRVKEKFRFKVKILP